MIKTHKFYDELSNEIFYKGFTGIINYCNQSNILFGCIIDGVPEGTHISYHGDTIEECIQVFKEMIDCHIEDLEEEKAKTANISLSA